MSELQEMIEMFTQAELERAGNSIAENLDMNPVAKFYYDQFVHEGLPILNTAHTTFNINAWIEYTGHPFSSVEVYNRDGSLKYSIPPLLRNLETPKGTMEDRYTDHIQELMSLRADNPMLASISAYNALTRITADDEEAHIEDGVKLMMVMNEIFRDHNLPELTIADFTKTSEEESAVPVVEKPLEDNGGISDDFEEL